MINGWFTGYRSTMFRFKVKRTWYEVRSFYLKGRIGMGVLTSNGESHCLNIPKFGDENVCWTSFQLED
jgi:hypothetical protein